MIYKTRRRYQGEPICADPTADPRENETALHFTAGDRRLWVSSYEPTVVSGLLAHPDFQIGHLVFMQVNGRECVVGVVGRLPVGALSLGRARKSDSHEFIIRAHLKLEVKHSPKGRKPRASNKKGRVHSKRRTSARRPRKRARRNR